MKTFGQYVVRDGDGQIVNGGPAHSLWCIPSPEALREMFGAAAPEPEPDADQHIARYLRGEAPMRPYDGSQRRRQPWKKAWDASHVHRLTCPSCREVSWCGDRHHHTTVEDVFPCECQRPGALADFHIKCPPGCSGVARGLLVRDPMTGIIE
jgi:hypothetical protein